MLAINPCLMLCQIQEMVKYLNGVVELLEAHFLGSWTAPTLSNSKRESLLWYQLAL